MTENSNEYAEKSLRDTPWLAKRLNLSITTIERFRVKAPKLLPPAIKIGNSIRYDEDIVEAWVKRKSNEDWLARQVDPAVTQIDTNVTHNQNTAFQAPHL